MSLFLCGNVVLSILDLESAHVSREKLNTFALARPCIQLFFILASTFSPCISEKYPSGTLIKVTSSTSSSGSVPVVLLPYCCIEVHHLRYHVTSCSYLSSHHSYFRTGTQHLPLASFSQQNPRSDLLTHDAAQFDGVHVVSGSLDTSIRVWDVESGACRHALMGHQVTNCPLQRQIVDSCYPELDLWDGVAGQHLGVWQRRLHCQDLGHPHRPVPSDAVR